MNTTSVSLSSQDDGAFGYGSAAGALGSAPPPPGAVLSSVRRLAAAAAGVRGLFARGDPDLEFGAFKVMWGPQVIPVLGFLHACIG